MATTNEVQQYTAPPPTLVERQSDYFDLGAIWLAFKRRALLFVAVAIPLLIASVVAYALTTPRYEAVSQVVINTDQQDLVNTPKVAAQAPDTYAVDTEVQVLKSRQLARVVVMQLGLWRDPEFAEGAQKAEADAATRSPTPAVARERAIEAATTTLLANRTVSRSGLAFAIDIAISSKNRQTAMRAANAYVDNYIGGQIASKSGATRQASQWLESQLTQLRGQVLASEAAVQRYRSQAGLLNTSPTETLTQSEIAGLNGQLATAQAELAERQAAANTARRQLSRGSSGDDVGEALGSAVITQLRQQRAEVSRQVADFQSRYGERHPDYLRAQSQLRDVDAQIAAEIRRVISGLDAQVRVAAGRVGSLQASLGRSQGTLAANSAAGVRLGDLERTADAVRTLYQTYLSRYRETSSQQGLQRPNAHVLSYATEPTDKASPKLPIYLAAGLLAALLGGSFAVAVAEALDRGIRSSKGVRSALGLRTIASIPEFRSTLGNEERKDFRKLRSDFVVERPFSAFTESFRILRAALYDHSTGRPHQVVALCSSLPREGKTTSAVCLARVAAIGGESTVLVECDTRRAGLRASRADNENGLLEVLAGTATLDQALQYDAASGAHVLPISRNALTPTDVLTSEGMDKLLIELRRRFQFIVLDTAPVLPIAETRVLASKADAVAYLVRWGRTPTQAALAGVRILAESGVPIAGVVLTQIDMRKQKNWGREDAAAYFDSYKSYYA